MRIQDIIVENRQDVSEGLNESGYEEAGELLSQPVPEIQQFVKSQGWPIPIDWDNPEHDKIAKKIGAMIDAAPDTQIPAASIPKLKNLANKGNDVQTLKAVQQISGRPDAVQQYAKLMQARDTGEGRNRGYDVSGLIKSVQSGNYEAPVLLKLPTGLYVIGGRTRLYAALALGIDAKVKIISANNFNQGVREGLDPYRLERLDPQSRKVLQRMADHAQPGSWLSAAEAYAMMLGLQYKRQDPRGWEQEVQGYVDLWNEITGKKS